MDVPSSPRPLLAYLFWHWPRSGADPTAYETDLLKFHASLAARPSPQFVRSATFAVGGVPWLPGHHDSYEDWYLVDDWTALGDLNRAAVGPAHAGPHDQVAHQAAGGTARSGPRPSPRACRRAPPAPPRRIAPPGRAPAAAQSDIARRFPQCSHF